LNIFFEEGTMKGKDERMEQRKKENKDKQEK
jgi:hypothetical protein